MIDKATIQRAKGSGLLSDLVTGMQKVAASGGGEYAGPCPFCGGEDRFRVQPASARWLCRHCTDGHWQDAIDFVRRRDNCSFAEAVTVLTGTSADQVNTRHTKRVVGAPTKKGTNDALL